MSYLRSYVNTCRYRLPGFEFDVQVSDGGDAGQHVQLTVLHFKPGDEERLRRVLGILSGGFAANGITAKIANIKEGRADIVVQCPDTGFVVNAFNSIFNIDPSLKTFDAAASALEGQGIRLFVYPEDPLAGRRFDPDSSGRHPAVPELNRIFSSLLRKERQYVKNNAKAQSMTALVLEATQNIPPERMIDAVFPVVNGFFKTHTHLVTAKIIRPLADAVADTIVLAKNPHARLPSRDAGRLGA